jgi:hypothetical protein
VTESAVRVWLEALEPQVADDPVAAAVSLAFVAGQELEIGDEELRGCRRRAVLLVAAGGDPRRSLRLDDRAVAALAAELENPGRDAALRAGFTALAAAAADLPLVSTALEQLVGDRELAWNALACALLAEELGEDG